MMLKEVPKEDVWIKPPTAAQLRFHRQQHRRRISCWMALCMLVAGVLLIIAGSYASYHLYHTMGSKKSVCITSLY